MKLETIIASIAFGAAIGLSMRLTDTQNSMRALCRTLQVQSFTIEAWIRRSRSDLATAGNTGVGVLFGYSWNGIAFGILNDGRLVLSKVGISGIYSSAAVKDTDWHHVVVAKDGNSVVFFVDGMPGDPISYDPAFGFTSNATIGTGGGADSGFLGLIDEVKFYNRGLGQAEVLTRYSSTAYGRCFPPSIAITSALRGRPALIVALSTRSPISERASSSAYHSGCACKVPTLSSSGVVAHTGE